MKIEILTVLVGAALTAAVGWTTWVTTAVWEDRARLARIEAKVDILVDRVVLNKHESK